MALFKSKMRQVLGDAGGDAQNASGFAPGEPDASGPPTGSPSPDAGEIAGDPTMESQVGGTWSYGEKGSHGEDSGMPPLPDAASGPEDVGADTPNTPLAVPGTFALPGSGGAAPFRSRNFLMNRGLGGEQVDYGGKKRRFGAGVPVSGSSASLGIDPEELTRRILNR